LNNPKDTNNATIPLEETIDPNDAKMIDGSRSRPIVESNDVSRVEERREANQA